MRFAIALLAMMGTASAQNFQGVGPAIDTQITYTVHNAQREILRVTPDGALHVADDATAQDVAAALWPLVHPSPPYGLTNICPVSGTQNDTLRPRSGMPLIEYRSSF
jgi:hypothetical protein